jgi:hypothetical protein
MTQTNDHSKIELDPWNTPAGAMENAFLAETISPGQHSKYSPEEALSAMRLMKQALENRLKKPSQYEARGAINEFDILRIGGQFPEFTPEGHLHSDAASAVSEIVGDAQNQNSAHYEEYRQYVQLAIQVANEKLDPSTVKWQNATAWRTTGHGSPGAGFYKIGDFGGNTFFGTIADLTPHRAPDAGKLHALALAAGKTHGLHSKLHDLALSHGGHGLGSFAPVPGSQKPAGKQPHRHGHAAHEHTAHTQHMQRIRPALPFRQGRGAADAIFWGYCRQSATADWGRASWLSASPPLSSSAS